MSIWNKVLVGLILVVALAMLVFAAQALHRRSYWGEQIKQLEEEIAKLDNDKQLLIEGNAAEGKPGIRQLKQEVEAMVVGRGRVWRNSQPKVAQGGRATVVTQSPAPHKDAVKTQLYVFEEPSGQGTGAYLGEFAVAAVAGQQWELQPVRPMTQAELARIEKSRGPWSLYEVMPGEPIEPAAGAPPQPSQATDYHVLFSDFYRWRAELQDLTTVTTGDVQSVEASEAAARQYLDLTQKDIASTKDEVKAMQAEHELVAKHRAALEAKLAELKDAIQKTDLSNRAAASELARLQLEAIRRIDERTSKVAQAARAQ
jgi:hypothetical protein